MINTKKVLLQKYGKDFKYLIQNQRVLIFAHLRNNVYSRAKISKKFNKN